MLGRLVQRRCVHYASRQPPLASGRHTQRDSLAPSVAPLPSLPVRASRRRDEGACALFLKGLISNCCERRVPIYVGDEMHMALGNAGPSPIAKQVYRGPAQSSQRRGLRIQNEDWHYAGRNAIACSVITWDAAACRSMVRGQHAVKVVAE